MQLIERCKLLTQSKGWFSFVLKLLKKFCLFHVLKAQDDESHDPFVVPIDCERCYTSKDESNWMLLWGEKFTLGVSRMM